MSTVVEQVETDVVDGPPGAGSPRAQPPPDRSVLSTVMQRYEQARRLRLLERRARRVRS